MTKKSKIIGAALVSFLLIGGGGVYYANEQKKAEQERIYVEKINDQVDSISKDLAKFEKETEENKKFEQLKSLISEFEEYKNGDEKDEKVIIKYQASIKTARQFFKEENEKQIEDNTPKELEKESISDLKVKTDTLNKLNEKIKNQKEIVYSEQEIQELNQKIEKLIKDFSGRIKELEKKEAEEKVVKEAKKVQEQQNKADEQYNETANNENVDNNELYQEISSNQESNTSVNDRKSNESESSYSSAGNLDDYDLWFTTDGIEGIGTVKYGDKKITVTTPRGTVGSAIFE